MSLLCVSYHFYEKKKGKERAIMKRNKHLKYSIATLKNNNVYLCGIFVFVLSGNSHFTQFPMGPSRSLHASSITLPTHLEHFICRYTPRQAHVYPEAVGSSLDQLPALLFSCHFGSVPASLSLIFPSVNGEQIST